MRKADLDTAWRKCREASTALSLTQIQFSRPDSDQPLEIRSRVIAVVGPNGAGKTRLLHSIESLLRGSIGDSQLQPARILGVFRGHPFEANSANPAPSEISVEFIDVSQEAHRTRTYFQQQKALQELLDQYEAATVGDKELPKFKYVSRRNYSEMRIWEVEGPASPSVSEEDDEESFYPFFQVDLDGLTYDTLTMGLGELCACYLLWRVFRAQKGSIILLDEPDSHLSPLSRKALLDICALAAGDMSHCIIFSTHAAELLQCMSEREIYVLHKNGSNPPIDCVFEASTKREVMRMLGLCSPTRILLVVEDVDAAEAIRQILNRWGKGLERSFEIQIVKDGASEIIKLVRLFPAATASLKLIAILDGDKRTSYPGIDAVLFMPSDEDPIASARRMLPANLGQLAELVGVTEVRLRAALDNVSHVDHHDFCASLLTELGTASSVPEIRAALIGIWFSNGAISQQSEALSDELHRLLALIPIDS